jgi:hypothetical protein
MTTERDLAQELASERLEPVGADVPALLKPKWGALGVRFLFGALIALAAGLVGMRFGPNIGGLFLAFPAVLPAALTILEKDSGKTAAEIDSLGAILGSFAMIAFAFAATITIVPLGGPPAVVAAWAVWLAVAVALFVTARRVLRALQ